MTHTAHARLSDLWAGGAFDVAHEVHVTNILQPVLMVAKVTSELKQRTRHTVTTAPPNLRP